MVCEMEIDNIEEMAMELEEVLPSMWPEDIDSDKQFNMEKPGQDQDMLEEVTLKEKPTNVDFKRLFELTKHTDTGSSQLANLVKHWEYKQANVVRLLREELDILSKQKQEVELKKLEILEEHRFESESYGGDKRPISILDEVYQLWAPDVPLKRLDVVVERKRIETEAEYDSVVYWKQRAMNLERLLEASVAREQILVDQLQESIKSIERQSSPVDELSEILKRADNFLHFVLQNAPVVIGHQDKELRYRFIYNHFPSLGEQDIIGKTDVEIFTGAGVKESQDFKREVLEKGIPAKREITFETELFGSKTFLIYVEPVFNKAGETIGINYMGMEVSDQVRKREKMAKLREEIAVQKAKETELNKTIHITEETMRAKQMLATMSHEIRSPLSGVVSMAEILTTTKLDREQRQLLEVMLSSGDLVLQLINDILDLSKVESGVMKLEATKFRPRQVVKHVLQTAAASLQKVLTLEGHIMEDVPVEVIGDVLRIRQILTNLISNAIKFTHEGKVGIKLYMVEDPTSGCLQKSDTIQSTVLESGLNEEESALQNCCNGEIFRGNEPYQISCIQDEPNTPVKSETSMNGDKEEKPHSSETKTVWLRCDVYDTGIGIPEKALPTLFKRYMQVSADHARKYGGTGLGLAICKQLVELMGGQLTVSSREHCGSTFTFVLPYKVSTSSENSDDPDELTDMADYDDAVTDDEVAESYIQFQPLTLGSLFSSNGTSRNHKLLSHKLNGPSQNTYSFPYNNIRPEETISVENCCSAVDDVAETLSETERSVSHTSNSKGETPSIRGRKGQDDSNSQSQNSSSDSNHHAEASRENGVPAKTKEPQGTCTRQENSDEDSECSSGNSSKIPKSTSKPKILLVEDNKINIMVAQSMMKQLGQSIEVVKNGAEAVRAFQRCRYDLILMDVHMPVMDGLQATRIIRSFEETGSWEAAEKAGIEQDSNTLENGHRHKPCGKRIPIIAMTANAFAESAEECFANGMDSFVPKPVTRQKLKEKLDQYLPECNLV
ncbi:histidine kinase 5 isoform X2 [Argentina anserina]|uniref:histidine kinase 5 isoform X2 n=1 Tax=Argentina anserina TaxID=57926 RepID=UPI0021763EB2|nr:histidine kinase 5 isoform X2 [Potentilla anserina]